jgi:hypothetical protein
MQYEVPRLAAAQPRKGPWLAEALKAPWPILLLLTT